MPDTRFVGLENKVDVQFSACDMNRELNSSLFFESCELAEAQFRSIGGELMSVSLCRTMGSVVPETVFLNFPQVLRKLADGIKNRGGCPIWQEAVHRRSHFDALEVDPISHKDFMSSRFLIEMRKLNYRRVWVVPLSLGDGFAVATIGMSKKQDSRDVDERCIAFTYQFLLNICSKFEFSQHKFSQGSLSTLEAQVLILATGGTSDSQIASLLGFSEFAIEGFFKSAMTRLAAKNRIHLIAIALAHGEILNVHTGSFDTIER